jgi:nitrate reductase assembly molybdenum cofactor insertion protein NarJ
LGLPLAAPEELASAYCDVFLLNVYPYGTAFIASNGELNEPEGQRVAALYAAHGYRPPELDAVGAPDHLGLGLGFLAHLEQQRLAMSEFASGFLAWAPICCLAVEREPSAHPFYRALAAQTRERLMADSRWLMTGYAPPFDIHLGPWADDEVSLRALVRFWLTPAQCGVFLSRSRLGRMASELGTRLPFGSRFEVAERLFAASGEAEQIGDLIQALKAEVETWAATYETWSANYPAWRPIAAVWLARTARAARQLDEMRRMVETETM